VIGSVYLKRSQFFIGVAKALRGLKRDIYVLIWTIKRNRRIADYLKSHRVMKLHLGASDHVLDDWLNTDISPHSKSVVYLDATKRFPFGDSTFHYIVGEHMIEHLEYHGAEVMMRECFRILKPGGRVRFATPDLQVLLALYSEDQTETQRKYIDWAVTRFMPEVRESKNVFVINNFFRAWGHCFLYDQQTLRYALYASGFRDIRFYKPGCSEDPMLRNLESHGKEIGEDKNQFETIVVEGRKELG
jgi:predicted SAM-dependent methyltransferase